MQRLLLPIAAVLLAAAPAAGTSVRPIAFDRLVRDAGIVAVGTVSSVSCRAVPDDPHVRIWTDVRIGKVRALKGAAADPLAVSHAGGRLGKRTVRVAGMPALAPGQRVVLFLRSGSPGICPFLGWGQGVLRVNGDEEIATSDGRPVREIEGGRLVLAPPDEEEGDRVRLSLEDLVEDIRARVRRQEAEEREKERDAEEAPDPDAGDGDEAGEEAG